MPVLPEQYDRQPVLTAEEQEALAEVAALDPEKRFLLSDLTSPQALTRLVQPLRDVYHLGHRNPKQTAPYLRVMCQQMARKGKPFWAWSGEEWLEVMASTQPSRMGIPVTIRAAAYLLRGLLITGEQFSPYILARSVFGNKLVQEQYERLAVIIFGKEGFGYTRSQDQEHLLHAALAHVILVNRNPYIDALTARCLSVTKPLLSNDYQSTLRWIARALVHLKIEKEDALAHLFDSSEFARWWEYNEADVDLQWLAWLRAYMAQTTRFAESYRKRQFYNLIIVGRWLKQYHPAITAPEQWDETLAQEYVAWVCNAKRGELVTRDTRFTIWVARNQMLLQAGSIESRLSTLRQFFKALQRKPHQVNEQSPQRLILTWNPAEAFATPENVRRQIVPNPRNLDHAWWHKLTWAAASLSAKDIPSHNGTNPYPLTYYRAAGLLWVTGARRSDEIRRLKVGCVSHEWVPEMRDEDGNQLEPEEHLAYLRVPVNKYQGEFWIPIPAYTADAIEAWEHFRPKLQISQIDRKEHKPTDYLFMMRNQLMGKAFLNDTVIPLLCKVAGLVDENGAPLHDTVGKITSHRARSTLATWLRSNGLSLTFIAKLLGHTDLKTLPWYLREDKYQFARAIRKHNPLDRMVTAILDTEALKRGAGEPAVFYYLGYGEDGRPHMCASPDYSTCVHQMHCRKCEMYVNAEQAEIIARRPGMLTIEVHIPTPPLIEEILDQEGLGEEITQHLPAPEVPDPAYHLNKSMPPRSSNPDLQQMKQELAALTVEWTEKEGKFDLRSVGMKLLKKRIADLATKIETQKSQPPPSNS
jgi:integrase